MGTAVDGGSGRCRACPTVTAIATQLLCRGCRKPALQAVPSMELNGAEARCPRCATCKPRVLVRFTCGDHRCCVPCFARHIQRCAAGRRLRWEPADKRYVVPCVDPGCDSGAADRLAMRLVGEAMVGQLCALQRQLLKARAKGVVCPSPRCGVPMVGVQSVGEHVVARCGSCAAQFCQVSPAQLLAAGAAPRHLCLPPARHRCCPSSHPDAAALPPLGCAGCVSFCRGGGAPARASLPHVRSGFAAGQDESCAVPRVPRMELLALWAKRGRPPGSHVRALVASRPSAQ